MTHDHLKMVSKTQMGEVEELEEVGLDILL